MVLLARAVTQCGANGRSSMLTAAMREPVPLEGGMQQISGLMARIGRLWAVLIAAALLSSCGGGGGGSGSKRFSVAFIPTSLSIQTIEGFAAHANFTGTIIYEGELYIGVLERANIVVDGDVLPLGSNGIDGQLVLSSSLAPGIYNTAIELLGCEDPNCEQQVDGSPARLPLRYEVLPQIKLASAAPMRRAGREPAPSQTLAAVLPATAGEVYLTVLGDSQAFDIALESDRVVVNSRQIRAGTYNATIVLQGTADPRYRVSVPLNYVIEPPPGGESPLRVEPDRFDLFRVQGTAATYRLKVHRPTWTDALTVTLNGTGVARDLRDVGNDEYEFTVDTRNVPMQLPGNSGMSNYFNDIVVRAGDYGGLLGVTVSVLVNPPLVLSNPSLDLTVDSATQPAELLRTSSVLAADGAVVPWSAASDSPWLRVARSSGFTGIDDLLLEVDPSVLDLPGILQVAQLTVSLARPGTLPVARNVGVRNLLPRFDLASPGVLTASTVTVFVHGRIYSDAGLLRAGVLSADGATLRGARIERDGRFIGDVALLAVDLGDVVAHQPVTLRANAPLRTARIAIPSVGTPTVAPGYVSLPFDRYRLPSFAAGDNSVAFSGTDVVWRWPFVSGSWVAPQSVPLSGVIDVAHSPGETDLMASAPERVVALDPGTLAVRRRGPLPGSVQLEAFDTRTPSQLGALRYARDGRAFAAVTNRDTSSFVGAGVGWLASCNPQGDGRSDIALAPCFSDPGSEWLKDTTGGPTGAGIARSPNGHTLAISYPGGQTELYRTIGQGRQTGERLPSGRFVLAIDDSGAWRIRDDGQLHGPDFSTGLALTEKLPAGIVAGGYALAGHGGFALVYAYRIADEVSGQRARDARLLIFDLRNGLAALAGSTAPPAQIDLPDAVGCNVLPQASGESCVHTAQLLIAPGDRAAFVLGPRGIAAVPLPIPVAVSAAKPRERPQVLSPGTVKIIPIDGRAKPGAHDGLR